MWEAHRLPTAGNFSLRQIALTFLAAVISALFIAISHSPVAFAADATWQGDNITLGSETFVPEAAKVTGPPSGAQIYSIKNGATAKILYIPSGADMTKEIKASVLEGCTVAPDTSINCPSPPKEISLDAKPGAKKKTQCAVDGVGWIVCMVSRFIANGMDNIFSIISDYLEVKTITDDTKGGLYQAWDVAKNLANMAFVVAFLVIIYSQITSVGFSNYNIKKMLPRLIIAAIAVNLSYYICAICVDLSNILGHNIQKALVDIRVSLTDPGAQSMDWGSWKNITEYVLSAGTITAGAFAAKAAFLGSAAGGSVSGLTFLLFPILVAGALAVLIAVLMLAARQALITALVVIAPFAFVAYLLPNTEKWFEKWRELFTTMLMLFPMFSLVFGGAQLASFIIITNADRLSVIIFAMFIQVAPLALTPMLVKFSGSLVGRIAGIANDPKKGLVDRARNWATDKAEVQRAKGQIAAQRGGGTRWQRKAYKRELDKQNRESWKKAGQAHVDAGWHQDSRYQRHHSSMSTAELIQKQGESKAELHFERQMMTDRNLQRYDVSRRANEDNVKNLQTQRDQAYTEMKTSMMPANSMYAHLNSDPQNRMSDHLRQIQRDQDVAESALNAAKQKQREEFGKALIADEALQARAGGIAGRERGLATGISEYRKAYSERVAEAAQVLKHFNLSGPERQDHALGKEVTVFDPANGTMKILRADSQYTREAAIEQQLATGTVQEINDIVEASGGALLAYRTTIQEAVASNRLSAKAKYLGGQTINDIGQGRVAGKAGLDAAILRTLVQGKISEGDLATIDPVALERILEVAKWGQSGQPPLPVGTDQGEFARRVTELKQAAINTLANGAISGSITAKAKDILGQMSGDLPGATTPPNSSQSSGGSGAPNPPPGPGPSNP